MQVDLVQTDLALNAVERSPWGAQTLYSSRTVAWFTAQEVSSALQKAGTRLLSVGDSSWPAASTQAQQSREENYPPVQDTGQAPF